jgi:hypothetical protein
MEMPRFTRHFFQALDYSCLNDFGYVAAARGVCPPESEHTAGAGEVEEERTLAALQRPSRLTSRHLYSDLFLNSRWIASLPIAPCKHTFIFQSVVYTYSI